jgi:TolB-like protein
MDSQSQDVLVLDDATREKIMSQVNRIVSSSLFHDSPQPSRFLRFVVDAVLSGDVDSIKQYTIAVDAFGYPADFDPHINPVMRVLAGRVRMMLERYYLHEGANDDILVEIPKRAYVPIFRLNPNRLAEAQSEYPTSPLSLFNIDYGLSIAVIPFIGQGPNDDNHFADNITDSIAMELARFRELKIVGPLREYKESIAKADEIVQRYHMRFMLEGRVQMYGDTVRIKASLTDTRTGYKIFSQTYEYSQAAMGILEIEDDVTRLIVSALADYRGIIPSLISRESMKKRLDGLDSYEAICSQMHFLKVFSMPVYSAAVEALEHAVQVDPDNAMVLAMLSHAYCCNYILDLGLESASLERAEHLARRALALDHECQMAHLSEAILLFLKGQLDESISKLQTANSLNPLNAFVIYSSGALFCGMGDWDEGMRLWKQALRLNPHPPPIYFMIPFMDHYRRGDYEAAWNYAKQFNAPIFWNPLIRAAAAGQLGLQTQAKAALQELLEMRPNFPSRARDLMRRLNYLEEPVEKLLEGLLKAGLKFDVLVKSKIGINS